MANKKSNGVRNKPSDNKASKTKAAKSRAAAAKVVPLQATIHSGMMSNGQTRAKKRS